MIFRLWLIVLVAIGLGAANALACDEYVSVSQQDLKADRDKLADKGADPLDRLFAFRQLACSGDPTIRAYSVQAALESSNDPVLRNAVLLEAMLSKSRVDVEFKAGKDATAGDKDALHDLGGLVSLPVYYHSSEQGCISFQDSDQCQPRYSAFVKGDKVEFGYGNHSLIGEFQLTESNELVGYLHIDSGQASGKMPAVIKLF